MAKPIAKNSGAKSGPNTKTEPLNLVGTEGAETFVGGEGNDIIDGRGGNDYLLGAGGNDYLIGGTGDDRLDGGTNYDQMDGGVGNDVFVVDHVSDFVIERIDGGTDTVISSIGYTLNPQLENLNLSGAGLIDSTGSYLDNQLTGNISSNRLDGREGNDLIDGGLGADVLTGGLGADTFAFTSALGGGVDRIVDFVSGTDRIALDDARFSGLAPGALPAGAFQVGAAAEADDRILYDPATGALSFDPDGVGGSGALIFATVQPGLAIGAGDFIVI